jgi:hypothetical protein
LDPRTELGRRHAHLERLGAGDHAVLHGSQLFESRVGIDDGDHVAQRRVGGGGAQRVPRPGRSSVLRTWVSSEPHDDLAPRTPRGEMSFGRGATRVSH